MAAIQYAILLCTSNVYQCLGGYQISKPPLMRYLKAVDIVYVAYWQLFQNGGHVGFLPFWVYAIAYFCVRRMMWSTSIGVHGPWKVRSQIRITLYEEHKKCAKFTTTRSCLNWRVDIIPWNKNPQTHPFCTQDILGGLQSINFVLNEDILWQEKMIC